MFYFTFQEVSSMSEKKNKILVADDEKEIRDILKLLLRSEGYEVTLACDELLMRVKAQLRRSQQYQAQMVQHSTSASSTALTLYDLTLDPDSQSVSKNGEVIILTHTEFKILELFLKKHKKIFSIDNIYQSVWEDNAVGDSTVMVHIKNLRKKLGDSTKNPKYIKTAWGKGYYVD